MTVESARIPRGMGLMQQAGAARREISHALQEQRWYSGTISQKVASAMLGISEGDMAQNPHTSILFHITPDGVTVSAGTKRQTAMEAFREWSSSSDDRSQNTFYRDAYMSFYTLFQAAAEAMGDRAYEEVAEFFGRTMAEQDPTWGPFLDRVRGYGDIAGDQDARIIHRKMSELWKKIPPGMQQDLASFSPKHLFNT